ncbi:MAG: hypothetical protein IT443_11850 [Phycisphaeraceae bacterium]|nr:hypothetical protein [Phycisphaeraceae bacterium]
MQTAIAVSQMILGGAPSFAPPHEALGTHDKGKSLEQVKAAHLDTLLRVVELYIWGEDAFAGDRGKESAAQINFVDRDKASLFLSHARQEGLECSVEEGAVGPVVKVTVEIRNHGDTYRLMQVAARQGLLTNPV